jgi:hypothetical protein
VIDGVFAGGEDGRVHFAEAAALTPEDLAAVHQQVRRRVLRWFARAGHLDPADAQDMAGWHHGGGFSLDASVRIEGSDRAGLGRIKPRARPRVCCSSSSLPSPFSLRRSKAAAQARGSSRGGWFLSWVVREITAATASAPESPARRRRDPDCVAPCAQPIPCRGLESSAQEGKTEGERLSRTSAQAGPGTAAAGRAELHRLSHRGGRGSSRSPPNPRCRR